MTRNFWEEEVNGTVIGDFTYPYQFWIDEPRQEYRDKTGIPKRKVYVGNFRNDEEAISYVKEHYPQEFKHGMEMRVFDV